MRKDYAQPTSNTRDKKGVTVQLLNTVDLGPEIEGMNANNFECGW